MTVRNGTHSAISTFRDVVVVPYTDLLLEGPDALLHRGGPRWPDFDQQVAARHHRWGKAVDHEPASAETADVIDGPWAWGGAIVRHFGHQIADFSMRVVPTMDEWPDARFLFASQAHAHVASLDAAPPFFWAILEWLGVARERVRFVESAVSVSELLVTAQAEQLAGPAPDARHLDRMDALMRTRLGTVRPEGAVYVSRAGMYSRFAGERYLEEALAAAGVRILRPESESLPEQVRTYASARTLIFAEGSAMYGTQLLGRALGDVVVLVRRPKWRLAILPLQPRAKTLTYVDVTTSLVCGLQFGEPAEWTALCVLDEDALLSGFDNLAIPLRQQWRTHRFLAARDDDVREWLAREATSFRSRKSESRKHIHESLTAAGLAHLYPSE